MNHEYCSFYEHRWVKNPTLVIVEDFLTDTTYKNQIERLRDTVDESLRAEIKNTLPCATISGICEGSHGNFRQHNGFICIDVDGKDNPHITDWPEFIFSLQAIPEIWFCGLSAGGKGCFLVTRIKYKAKHREHFKSIERFFRDRLEITIDSQCINENRLRYQSYNTPETSWFNHDAKTWQHRVKIETRTAGTSMPSCENYNKVKLAAIRLYNRGIDITAGDKWVHLGNAFINEFGDRGKYLFDLVSRRHPDYSPEEVIKKYNYWSKRPYPYTIRTFFFYCKQAGLKI
jgi:hypothetical protein